MPDDGEHPMAGPARGAAAIPIEDKVAALRRPGSYPDEAVEVKAVETHMSWVFLTAGRAYKLKKPVRTSYLDFSTLDARHADSRVEVRLNRRLAGAVYLGLSAVVDAGGGRLRVAEPGRFPDAPVADWLVAMRRLPDDATLERRIEAGGLHETDLRRLAAVLATFYRNAAHEPMGAGAALRRHRGIVADARADLGRERYGMDPQRVRRLCDALDAYLERRPGPLEHRARGGRVVEAHGDLRPEHVYLTAPPRVLDALEFDRNLRRLDPAHELAYLEMECARLGAPGAGAMIRALCLDLLGDGLPPDLLAFYRAEQAALRATIALWHLDQPQPREPDKWPDKARGYLTLAEAEIPAMAAAG